jgi:hypothetical protein
MMKKGWRPSWAVEFREPAFAAGPSSEGGGKYLYGNMPAYDILKLEQNEGCDYAEDVHLLFAGTHESMAPSSFFFIWVFAHNRP